MSEDFRKNSTIARKLAKRGELYSSNENLNSLLSSKS